MLKKQILLFFFTISIIPFCHATSSTPKELLNQFMTTEQLHQFKSIQTKKFKKLLNTVPPEELINLNKYIIHALRFHFLILGREVYSCLRQQDTDFFFLSLQATLRELKRLEGTLASLASKKFIIKFDKYLLKCSGFSHRDQVKLFYLRTYCSSLLSTFYEQLSVCEKLFFEDTVLPKEVSEQKYKPLSTFWLVLQRTYQNVFQYSILTSVDKLVLDSEIITACSDNFDFPKIKKQFVHLADVKRFKDRFKEIESKLSEQQKISYNAALENLQRITQKINTMNSSELNGKTLKDFTRDFYTSLTRFFDHAHLYFALYSSSFNALQEAIQTSSNIPQKERMAIALQCDSYNDLCTLSNVLVTGSASKEFFNISQSLEDNLSQEVTFIQSNSSTLPSKNSAIPAKLNILRHSRTVLLNKIKNINKGFYKCFVALLPWAGDDEVQQSIYPSSWINNPNNKDWIQLIDPVLPLVAMLITRNKTIEENKANRIADEKTKELLNNTQKKTSKPLHSIASEELGLPNKKLHQAIRGLINMILKMPTDTNKPRLETIVTTFAQSNYLLMKPLLSNQKLFDKSLPKNLNYTRWVLKELQHQKGPDWINNNASRFFQKLFHAYPSLFITLHQKQISKPLCHVLDIPYNTSKQTILTLCPSRFTLTNKLFPASQTVPQNSIHSGVFLALQNQQVDSNNQLPVSVEFNGIISPHYPLEALIGTNPKTLISEQFIENELIDLWSKQLPTFTPDDLKTITHEALESLRFSLFVPAYKQFLLESQDVKETLPIVREFNTLFHQMITTQKKPIPLSPKAAEYIDLYKKECFKDSTIHPDAFINYLDFMGKCNQNLKTFYGFLKKLDTELFKTAWQHTSYTLKDSEGKLVDGADILGKLFLELYKYPYLLETNQLNTLNHSILSTSLKSNNPQSLLFFETRLFNRCIEIKNQIKKTGALTAYSTLTNDGLIDTQVSLKELQERVNAILVTRREKIVALLNMHNAYQQNIDAMPHDFILNSPRYFTYYKALFVSLFTQKIDVLTKTKIAQALRFLSLRDILLMRNKTHTPLIEKMFSEAYFLYENVNASDTNILSKNEKSVRKELLTPLIKRYQNQHITKKRFPNPEILNFSNTVSELNKHYKVIMNP